MTANIVVQEQITVFSGDLLKRSYPGKWDVVPFSDSLSKRSKFNSDVYEHQQFTAWVTGGIDKFPPDFRVPLIIREQNRREYGTLNVHMYGDRVDINGDGGNVPDCPIRTVP